MLYLDWEYRIMKNLDLNKSLEQLENDQWIKPDFDSSLVEKCHQLRKLPLRELNVESYRILIGQNIGLQYLIPLAIQELQKNPLAEGDFYEGDLLCNVLRVEKKFWDDNKELIVAVREIINVAQKMIKDTEMEIKNDIGDAILVFEKSVENK